MSLFTKTYQERIGKPSTEDESQGYLIFALGVIAGLVGMGLLIFSEPSSAMREAAIVMAASGLALLIAGPVIRLPLRRMATTLVVAGLVACGAAIVWFTMVFPQAWSLASGNESVLLLYAAGITLMGIGGIFVPLLTSAPETATRERQRTTSGRSTDPGAGDARRKQRADAKSTRNDAERERLQAALAGAREDEADLAAELAALRTSRSRFEVFEADDGSGKWHWRLRHEDGTVLADDAGTDHPRRQDAQQEIARVRREALGATLLHMKPEEVPEPTEAFESTATAASARRSGEARDGGTFELYKGASGNWRWRLRNDGGKTIADGGESFTSKANARRSILSVQENVGPADQLLFDPTGFQVYRDKAGQWRWRLVHSNGNILADSGQGYTRRHDAKRAIDRIQEGVGDMDIEVYEDEAGEHRWRMTASNGRIVADGGEGYTRKADAREAVDHLPKHAANADLLEIGLAAFELVETDEGGHQWRLRHRNGNLLAKGPDEGFGSRSGARGGIEAVKRNAPGAEIKSD